jgi:hypothetical protein
MDKQPGRAAEPENMAAVENNLGNTLDIVFIGCMVGKQGAYCVGFF